jgi:uncharacterized protein YceH (UPF0502 family)
MSQSDSSIGTGPSWVPLTPRERRVVAVLAEKSRMTPEYYPMSVSAIVAGCNQKSNRDPITNYDQDDVEDTLQNLRKKGATILVEGSGRVPKWRHTLYDWLKATKSEMAVIIELLLRGPQTEGELRARASRMEPLPELSSLQALLDSLTPRGLVVYLSPPGQKRGVVVAHGLYPPEEFEKVRQAYAASAAASGDDESPTRLSSARAELAAAATAPGWTSELAAVRAEMDELRNRVETLSTELRELKSELGV